MIAATCIGTLMDWLNDNAGAITAIATVVLALVTLWYVKRTGHIVKHTARQADLLEKRDADRARQAITAIVMELLANEDAPNALVYRYFLDDAYRQGLSALSETDMKDITRRFIALAYKAMRIANATAMSLGITDPKATVSGDDACMAIRAALMQMQLDRAFANFRAQIVAQLGDLEQAP